MKTIIIVSKCIRVTKQNQYENAYTFHFQGVYAGEILKKLVLKGRKDFLIKKNEEYLMYVQMMTCINGVLEGKILKCKSLEECWDKS